MTKNKKEEYFDQKPTEYPFPENTDEHYLKIKKDNGAIFDENYHFIDKSRGFRFQDRIVRILLSIIGYLIARIAMGLKVKGKKYIKEHKAELKNGVVSVSNHINLFDYMSILYIAKPIKPRTLVWAKNIKGESSWFIRHVGGIPIPEDNVGGALAYYKTVNNFLSEEKGWLHIYAEGSMWEYYKPIRPFKRGAAYFAIKNNKPVLPIAFSYRKCGWLRKLLFKTNASITLHVGELIYPNLELGEKEAIKDLTIKTHDAVCRLAGIEPSKNIYGAIYNNDKRVDYY